MSSLQICYELARLAHQNWLSKQPADRVSIKYGHNIAVPWDKLDETWQKDQMKTFTEYAELVSSCCTNLPEAIHNIWMKNNSWEKEYKPHLFVPYEELSDDEKNKDIDIVNIIMKFK